MPVEDPSSEAEPTYAMVALLPSEDEAAQLSLDGGEPKELLHITLIYLGPEATEEFDREQVEGIVASVAERFTPMAGIFNGMCRFGPEGEGRAVAEVGEIPLVTTFDCPNLSAFREALADALADVRSQTSFPEDNHGFVPHMTLRYVPGDEDVSVPEPSMLEVTFSEVAVCWGNYLDHPENCSRFPFGETTDDGKSESKMGADMSKRTGMQPIPILIPEDEEEPAEPQEIPENGHPPDSASIGKERNVAEPIGEGRWEALFVTEDEWTDDDRFILPNAVGWRDPPLPIMWTRTATGHSEAQIGGSIVTIERKGNEIRAEGIFSADESGQEFRRLVGDGILTWLSIDMSVEEEIIEEDPEDFFKFKQYVVSGLILGVTAVPFPAQGTTWIRLMDEAAEVISEPAIEPEPVSAGGGPLKPPAEWFQDPEFTEPTHLTVTEEGRVFGHAAFWDVCHIGIPGQCLEAPHSETEYHYFATGVVECDNDELVNVGVITMNTGHAGLELNAKSAAAHYDHTGTGVMDVAIGEDEYGVWIAGALRPDVTDEQKRILRASDLSGDWRPIRGSLELVAILVVNVPGFPMPKRQARVAGGNTVALVAAAIPESFGTLQVDEGMESMRKAMKPLLPLAAKTLDDRMLESQVKGLDRRVNS